MIRFLFFVLAFLFGSAMASADEPTPEWEAARNDPMAYTKNVLARGALQDSIARSKIETFPSVRGSTIRVVLQISPNDGLLRAEQAAFSALVWAFGAPVAKDEEPPSEVALVFEWPDKERIELYFPKNAIVPLLNYTIFLATRPANLPQNTPLREQRHGAQPPAIAKSDSAPQLRRCVRRARIAVPAPS